MTCYRALSSKYGNWNAPSGTRISFWKSLTRSFSRDRVELSSSSAERTKVYSHLSCLGRVHALAYVYLLRFLEVRDQNADSTVRGKRQDIFWRKFARILAKLCGMIVSTLIRPIEVISFISFGRNKFFFFFFERKIALCFNGGFLPGAMDRVERIELHLSEKC